MILLFEFAVLLAEREAIFIYFHIIYNQNIPKITLIFKLNLYLQLIDDEISAVFRYHKRKTLRKREKINVGVCGYMNTLKKLKGKKCSTN